MSNKSGGKIVARSAGCQVRIFVMDPLFILGFHSTPPLRISTGTALMATTDSYKHGKTVDHHHWPQMVMVLVKLI